MAKNHNTQAYNKMLALSEAKEHFHSLCLMYENLGVILEAQSEAIKYPVFATSEVPKIQMRALEQYQEIGEQMKNIGACLDLVGGKPVMKADEPDPGTFVSNITPEKKYKE